MSPTRRSRLGLLALALLLVACPSPEAQISGPTPVHTDEGGFDRVGRVYTDVTPGNDDAVDVTVLDDGRVVLLGRGRDGERPVTFVVAYSAAGEVDTAFGREGVAVLEEVSGADRLVATADGGMLVVATPGDTLELHRVAADGGASDDGSWATRKVPAPPGDVVVGLSVHDAVLLDSGVVAVAGGVAVNREEDVGGCCAIEPDSAPLVARFLADGQPDTGFGDDGLVVGDIEPGEGHGLSSVTTLDGDRLLAVTTADPGLVVWSAAGEVSVADDFLASVGAIRPRAVRAVADGVVVAGTRVDADRDAVVVAVVPHEGGSAADRVAVYPVPDQREFRFVAMDAVDDGSAAVVGRLVERDSEGIPTVTEWAAAVTSTAGQDLLTGPRDAGVPDPVGVAVLSRGDVLVAGTVTVEVDGVYEHYLALYNAGRADAVERQ